MDANANISKALVRNEAKFFLDLVLGRAGIVLDFDTERGTMKGDEGCS